MELCFTKIILDTFLEGKYQRIKILHIKLIPQNHLVWGVETSYISSTISDAKNMLLKNFSIIHNGRKEQHSWHKFTINIYHYTKQDMNNQIHKSIHCKLLGDRPLQSMSICFSLFNLTMFVGVRQENPYPCYSETSSDPGSPGCVSLQIYNLRPRPSPVLTELFWTAKQHPAAFRGVINYCWCCSWQLFCEMPGLLIAQPRALCLSSWNHTSGLTFIFFYESRTLTHSQLP